MKILLVHKEEKNDKCQELINSLIENFKIEIVSREDFSKSDLENKDLVITLGGDGTFITVAQITSIPVLSINSNPEKSEGYLTKYNIEDKEKIIKILKNKDFKTEFLPAIEVEINNNKLERYGINEVFIGAEKHYHVSRYKLKHEEKEEEHRSSGILISTSTGSTAWWKSAGGTPFTNKKELKFLVREPYKGRIYKPEIIEGTINNELELDIINPQGLIVLDSQTEIPVKHKDKIKVRLINNKIQRII